MAVMYLGRIVETGPSRTVYQHPIHPYTEALLSAAPVPDPLKKREKIILAGDVPSPINPPAGCAFHPRCKYQQGPCREATPVIRQLEEEHWAACHFPLESKPHIKEILT